MEFRSLFVAFSAVGIGCLRLVSYTFRNLGFGFPGLSSTVWKICRVWTWGVEVLHVGMPTQWAKMQFPGMQIGASEYAEAAFAIEVEGKQAPFPTIGGRCLGSRFRGVLEVN